MQEKRFFQIAYLIVALGLGLALVTAVVPHPPVGHKLVVGAALVGMMPYVAYGIAVAAMRHWAMLAPGAVILALDLVFKVPERFVHYAGELGAIVFYLPLVATFVVLPIGLVAARSLQRSAAASAGEPSRVRNSTRAAYQEGQ